LHVQGCQLCGCAVCLLCRLLAQVVNHLIPAAAGAEHIKEESQSAINSTDQLEAETLLSKQAA
jgi:hypothetical protein